MDDRTAFCGGFSGFVIFDRAGFATAVASTLAPDAYQA